MELYPARRIALAAELIQLRHLYRALRRHPRSQHPEVQHAMDELRDRAGDVAVLLDDDLDHERLLASAPAPRRR